MKRLPKFTFGDLIDIALHLLAIGFMYSNDMLNLMAWYTGFVVLGTTVKVFLR